MGFCGLHRIYNGKIVSGLIWLCTFGLLGVGQFIDLFLISGMVEENNMRWQMKQMIAGQPTYQVSSPPPVPLAPPPPPKTPEQLLEELRMELLKAAKTRNGMISVTDGVYVTGKSFKEVEQALMEMVKSGYLDIDNHPESGVVVYRFREL
jgi:hypothetical protein